MKKTDKVMMGITFALALIPVFFQWFDIGNGAKIRDFGWRGIGILRIEFFASVLAYYVSLYWGKWWAMICAQGTVIASYFIALSRFTVRTNISSIQNWELTMSGLQWTFGLAIATITVNILLTAILSKKARDQK